MKDYIQSNKKGLFMVTIAAIILGVSFCNKVEVTPAFEAITISYDKLKVNAEKEITEEDRIELIINEHIEEINFYADTFQIERNELINLLKKDFYTLNIEDKEKLDKILIDYLLQLEKSEKDLFSKEVTPCTDNKDYIVALISYFSNVYKNVDYKIASAIAEIESAYSAPTMLKKNNIFGGLSSGKLIGYKNIEYGVLRYIKLLSEGYFGKGLTTVESIGRIYNPIFNENGKKIANPSWVKNVNRAISKYENISVITEVGEIVAINEAV